MSPASLWSPNILQYHFSKPKSRVAQRLHKKVDANKRSTMLTFTFTVSSFEPETTIKPLKEKLHQFTTSSWPLQTVLVNPVSLSQTLEISYFSEHIFMFQTKVKSIPSVLNPLNMIQLHLMLVKMQRNEHPVYVLYIQLWQSYSLPISRSISTTVYNTK